MDVDQVLKQGTGVGQRNPGQGGRTVRVDVLSRHQPQQPEHPPLGRVELP